MLWFGKKKDKSVEAEMEEENEYEKVSEAEILEALEAEEDDNAFDEEVVFLKDLQDDGTSVDDGDEDMPENEDVEEDGDSELDVTKKISDFNELCEFINTKPVGYVQYMRKSENEVFQLKEYHLRLAKVWTSSSMYRQYTDKEYARIMLASEVISAPEEFYVLPMFTDSETEAAISTFCDEILGVNGKKYAKSTAKFAKLVSNGGYEEEWKKYTADLMLLKVERFCKKNGITFDDKCSGDGEQNDE